MPETDKAHDELLAKAARLAREVINAALSRFTAEQRDAFWKAVGLHYSARSHPGLNDPRRETLTT